MYKALKAFYEEWEPIAQRLKDLKELIVTTAKKREEAKVEKEVALKKKFTDSASLIKVLTQHLEEYVERAGKMAAQQYDDNMEFLKKHDWDLDKAIPAPEKGARSIAWRAYNTQQQYYLSITDKNGDKLKSSEAKKQRMIEDSKKAAHASYMAWVAKMTDKIGKVVKSAEMSGNPWTGSTLKVVTADDEEQVWHNKMIINQSKYEKLFNQFPSRRAK